MAQVLPVTKPNQLGSILPIVGAVGGGIIGTLAAPGAGTAAGATMGASMGGALMGAGAGLGLGSGLASITGQTPQTSPNVQRDPNGDFDAMAMARRQQLLSQTTLEGLRQAESALPNLPEQLRQQYAPAIIQARMIAQSQQGGI